MEVGLHPIAENQLFLPVILYDCLKMDQDNAKLIRIDLFTKLNKYFDFSLPVLTWIYHSAAQ